MRNLYRKTQATRQVSLENRVDSLERRYIPTDTPGSFSCACCLPPPGSIVRPGFHQSSGLAPQPAALPTVEFPGGVIVAGLQDFVTNDTGSGDPQNFSPSRNGSAVDNTASSFDDSTEGWVFRPVDDFGLREGVLYGMFFSWQVILDGGTAHIESRSNNNLAPGSTDLWINGGWRHQNAACTPSTLEWALPGDLAEYGYYGMWPVNAATYGDWTLQLGVSDYFGLAFMAGETITVKGFVDGGGSSARVYIDHIVFMPTYPMGINDTSNLDSQINNFQSSALEVFGYYENPQPGSVTEVTDLPGAFFGSDVTVDTQQLTSLYLGTPHFTIASHDESDIEGTFVGVGGVHIYVLCRTTGITVSGTNTNRNGGHVSVFTGNMMLADILCDEANNWVWAYGGVMPLGDSPQGAVMLMQWRNDAVAFQALSIPTDVRSSFIAYLPQAPCEVVASDLVDQSIFTEGG